MTRALSRMHGMALAAALAGCGPDGRLGGDGSDSARVIEEGTPEALGVLAFLNDASTTLAVLDVDAALEARAATNLIAHRNGADGVHGTGDDDRFDTIAEVDGVSRVGDATLRALLAYADANGWIASDDPLYGVIEGVELTTSQAVDVLRVANGATEDELDDDVGLDARAATGIVGNRPFGIVEDVAVVSYVGPAALRSLIAYGDAHPIVLLTSDTAIPVLEIHTAGLWFTSESDYPLDVWALPGADAPITAANVKSVIADAYVPRSQELPLAERDVEEVDLAWAFDRYTVEQEWWEDSQRADAVKWRALRAVFETQLADPQVFRFGERRGNVLSGAIDVFVFGVTRDGGLVGFRTVSVET